ncbi:hypothetical protein MNBD_NITROSPINAE01-619 [hydrothermal vent metagenome]|uniref:3-deoxy-D-manno-octulosonic-acid transferase N-terminal domain-containing protein n=1 Tax=hydrothermal vent metagenome TaxID=652676 RepID=A0A3B1CPE8_9ZZZZ
MPYLIYNSLLYIGAFILSPLITWRLATTKKHRAGFSQKLGFYPPRNREKTIWIHAVSVGEVVTAEKLARALSVKAPNFKIVITVTTPTGHEVATKKLSDIADILYFPYDFSISAKKAVQAINPAIFITIDTEIWPNVMRACKKAGACVVLANGRISDRSYPRYKSLSWFFKAVLLNVDAFLMQGETDAKRIVETGADPLRVKVTGSLKFDSTPPGTPADKETLKRLLGIGPNEKIFLLGSVHEGEETAIRGAIKAQTAFGELKIVIAPRRIENLGWIEKTLEGTGLTATRKSQMPKIPEAKEKSVLIIDTFGELSKLYSVADLVFVGGSLINHGGQNPLEPAGYGVAPMFGPSMSNFRDVAETLLGCGGAWRVENETEIENLALSLLNDPQKRKKAGASAKSAVDKNRGTTDRTAEEIVKVMNG